MEVIVNVPKYTDTEDFVDRLVGDNKYLNFEFIVKEINQKHEFPKIKRGFLKTPEEILGTKSCTIHFYDGNISKEFYHHGNKKVIIDGKFPEHFYKEIEEEIDYSKIPKGSIVKLINKINFKNYFVAEFIGIENDEILTYDFEKLNNVKRRFLIDWFIEIIRWGKG
jgi:hypothetical protein